MPKTTINWDLVKAVLQSGRNACFYGPPGTGKTHIGSRWGIDKATPLFTVTLTEETLAADLRGMLVPEAGGGLGWLDGPILQWWRQGGRLVLNEVDKASGDALSLLYVALDDPDLAAMSLPSGETVRPSDKPRQVIGTMNVTPDQLPEPLQNRMLPFMFIDQPHLDAFEHLPSAIKAAAINSVTCTDDARQISLREWYAMAELMAAGLTLDLAVEALYGSIRCRDILGAIKLTKKA